MTGDLAFARSEHPGPDSPVVASVDRKDARCGDMPSAACEDMVDRGADEFERSAGPGGLQSSAGCRCSVSAARML